MRIMRKFTKLRINNVFTTALIIIMFNIDNIIDKDRICIIKNIIGILITL